LVGTLHVIKGKEQTFEVKALEVALPVVHRTSREVSLRLEDFLLNLLLVLRVTRHEESLVDGKRTLNVNDILVLHQRNVQETTVEHVQYRVLVINCTCWQASFQVFEAALAKRSVGFLAVRENRDILLKICLHLARIICRVSVCRLLVLHFLDGLELRLQVAKRVGSVEHASAHA
jgi:hypothetical protein